MIAEMQNGEEVANQEIEEQDIAEKEDKEDYFSQYEDVDE